MNYYEIPPNNCLFSRRWLQRDEVNSESYEKMVHKNIDSINRKLEDLEFKLRSNALNWDIIPVNDTQRSELKKALKKQILTIRYLKSSIGVWQSSHVISRDGRHVYDTRMLYPDKNVNMNSRCSSNLDGWDSDILGPTVHRPSDVGVVMLSDKAVKWLNGLRIMYQTVNPSFYSTARI